MGARSFVRPKIPLRLNGRGKTEEGGGRGFAPRPPRPARTKYVRNGISAAADAGTVAPSILPPRR